MSRAYLPQGLVRVPDYRNLLQSGLFRQTEEFSDNFIRRNSKVLSVYSRRWVSDPFHKWSRQWEYPFVFLQIEKYLQACSRRPLRILDAGSGITFFPYFVVARIDGAEVTCCDTNAALSRVYASVSRNISDSVCFLQRDIGQTGLEDKSFDIIYCISVLEHTTDYGRIVREFARILNNGGMMVITFDVSLDGRFDIPLDQVKRLINTIRDYLEPTDPDSLAYLLDAGQLSGSDIVTTEYFLGADRTLLPWKHPLISSLIGSVRRLRWPYLGIKRLAFACHAFYKRS